MPENLEKFLKWFWEKEEDRPFEHKDLYLLSDRVKKVWPTRMIWPKKGRTNALIWFMLKDLNIGLIIQLLNGFYFVKVHPGTIRCRASMHMYLKNHDEIIRLIKKLYEYKITGKILKRYIPESRIPASLKGRKAK